jgi:Mannosyltransferase (PIG-V)
MRADGTPALRDAWRALWLSRALVWTAGVASVLAFGRLDRRFDFDPAGLTDPFGRLGDLLIGPAARWDSVWFLMIADQGYASDERVAFFPAYPLLLHVTGWGPASRIVAGVLISTALLLVALVLVHRLTTLELGAAAARPAVLAVAFFPMAFFFSAVYSESLFLALSAGAFYAARRGRWALAGITGALAAGTRSAGLLLLLPVALLYLYGPRSDRPLDRPEARWWVPRHRLRRDVLWLAVIPAGLAAYMGYLEWQDVGASAPFHAQDVWFRQFAGPFGGLHDAIVAAYEGARQLLQGSRLPVRFRAAGGDPYVVASHNLVLFAFLLAAVPAVIGVLRRLPAAYGAYVLAALALPLSYPVGPQPLMSLPRFLAVLFPLHMWAGFALSRRPRREAVGVLALAAGALAFFSGAFATWHWVA